MRVLNAHGQNTNSSPDHPRTPCLYPNPVYLDSSFPADGRADEEGFGLVSRDDHVGTRRVILRLGSLTKGTDILTVMQCIRASSLLRTSPPYDYDSVIKLSLTLGVTTYHHHPGSIPAGRLLTAVRKASS